MKTIGTTEAAAILDVTTARVKQLLRARLLKGEKVGRDWRTTEAACRDYVREMRPDKWHKLPPAPVNKIGGR